MTILQNAWEVVVWDRMAEREERLITVYAITWGGALKAAERLLVTIGDEVNGNEYEHQFVIKSITCGNPNDL